MSAINGISRNLANYTSQITDDEQKYLNSLPPEKKEVMMLQMKMEKQRELVSFITNILKQMHESRMAVINNMR